MSGKRARCIPSSIAWWHANIATLHGCGEPGELVQAVKTLEVPLRTVIANAKIFFCSPNESRRPQGHDGCAIGTVEFVVTEQTHR